MKHCFHASDSAYFQHRQHFPPRGVRPHGYAMRESPAPVRGILCLEETAGRAMLTEKQKQYQKLYRQTHPLTQERKAAKWEQEKARWAKSPEKKKKHQLYDKLYHRAHPLNPVRLQRKKDRERVRYLKKTDYVKASVVRWQKLNADKIKVYARRSRINNRENISACCKRWAKEHPQQRKEIYKRAAAKIRSTPLGKLQTRMGTALWYALRGKKCGVRWEVLLGYTASDLKQHIEAQFKNGMTWDAYMRSEIEIHHVIPQFHFHYETTHDADFKRCWALSNLTPLWRQDHWELHKHFPMRKNGVARRVAMIDRQQQREKERMTQ